MVGSITNSNFRRSRRFRNFGENGPSPSLMWSAARHSGSMNCRQLNPVRAGSLALEPVVTRLSTPDPVVTKRSRFNPVLVDARPGAGQVVDARPGAGQLVDARPGADQLVDTGPRPDQVFDTGLHPDQVSDVRPRSHPAINAPPGMTSWIAHGHATPASSTQQPTCRGT